MAASGAPPDAELAPGDIFRHSAVAAAGTVQGGAAEMLQQRCDRTVPGKLPPA